MAVDEALTEAVDNRATPPVLRLYRWRPSCLSLGASQPFTVADSAFCAAHGIDLVRRPTGGRAVLHHLELTYLVAVRLGKPFGFELQAVYAAICWALVVGLRSLGVPAELAERSPAGTIRPTDSVPCFIGPAAGEVVVGGRKLIGSAMRRIGDTVLQHGSILEDWDSELQAGCLGLHEDRGFRSGVVTLSDLTGTMPAEEVLVGALLAGFRESLGVIAKRSALTDEERSRAHFLLRERYGHERWTVHRDRFLPVC